MKWTQATKNESKRSWNTKYMKTEFRDRKHRTIIHQSEHNETVIKSKYENNWYWLWDHLEYLLKTIIVDG